MPSKTLFKGDPISCPHCGRQLAGTVEKYHTPGGGSYRENQCRFCLKTFCVESLGRGLFAVDKEHEYDYMDGEDG